MVAFSDINTLRLSGNLILLLTEPLYVIIYIVLSTKSIYAYKKLNSLTKHTLLFFFIYGYTLLRYILAAFSVSSFFMQSVGLLEREISPSQGRYLHTHYFSENLFF
jgi:hypothetical protein